jgi:hypothetical protein
MSPMLGPVKPPHPRIRYYAGLDVGMVNDYSALAIFERVRIDEEHLDRETRIEDRLVHLERWRIPYPELQQRLGELFARPELVRKSVLTVDATGVGLAVYEDLRRDARLTGSLRGMSPVVITGGETTSEDHGRWHVPKVKLITPLQVAFQRGDVKIPRGLPYLEELKAELQGYEATIMASRNVRYSNNPREGGPDHDDLVLAAALAYWRLTVRTKRRTVQAVSAAKDRY